MGVWERGILEILTVKCGGSQRSCFFNKVTVICKYGMASSELNFC